MAVEARKTDAMNLILTEGAIDLIGKTATMNFAISAANTPISVVKHTLGNVLRSCKILQFYIDALKMRIVSVTHILPAVTRIEKAQPHSLIKSWWGRVCKLVLFSR
jgi:hypothetical protein